MGVGGGGLCGIAPSYYNSQFVCLFACFFDNYSQMIGPKGFKFSGFSGGHPGMVMTKLGEDQFVQKLLPDDLAYVAQFFKV